jgi:multiple sugar transport system permease protein
MMAQLAFAGYGDAAEAVDTEQARAGQALAFPAAALLCLLLFVPSALVLLFSVTDYQFGMSQFRFVGIENYQAMFADPRFRQSAANTGLYLAIVAPVSVLLALWLSVVIDRQGIFRGLFQTVFFLPVTATLVAMATAWEVLLHPSFGLVNNTLTSLGAEKVRFFSDPDTALYTLAFIGVWKQVGYNILLFTAGLSTISPDLYEAAAIDGADRGWKKFLLVTLPMLAPVTTFVIVITLIRAFSEFETVAVLTRGGPVGSTQMIQYTLFEEAFRFFNVGMASSIAVSFLVLVSLLSVLKVRLLDRKLVHG